MKIKIATRYTGPTNSHGGRITAKCEAQVVTRPYLHKLNAHENHEQAARDLVGNAELEVLDAPSSQRRFAVTVRPVLARTETVLMLGTGNLPGPIETVEFGFDVDRLDGGVLVWVDLDEKDERSWPAWMAPIAEFCWENEIALVMFLAAYDPDPRFPTYGW